MQIKNRTLYERTSVVASGSSTTLLDDSASNYQIGSGASSSSFQLPDATTCLVGRRYYFGNRSTGVTTVKYNDATQAVLITPSTERTFLLVDNSTTNGVWDITTGTGSGSGSGGSVEFLSNPSGQASTLGWRVYANTPGPYPVTGIGGSPGIALVRSTTAPVLTGIANLQIQKPASNVQGQGASIDIPLEKQYNDGESGEVVLKYRFNSAVLNPGDLSIVLIDLDNANAIIYPNPSVTQKGATVGGINSHQAVWQIPTNSSNLRFCIHFATTNAAACSIDFAAHVGPQQTVFATTPSDWVPYPMVITGTGSNPSIGSPVIYQLANWRRLGDSIEIHYELNVGATGGVGGAGSYLFSLPAGLSADTTKTAGSAIGGNEATNSYGNGSVAESGGAPHTLVGVQLYDPQHFVLIADDGSPVGSGFCPLSNANVAYSFTARIPIAGWTSQLQVQNIQTTARYSTTAGQIIPDVTDTVVNLDTEEWDDSSLVTIGAGWNLTAKVAGKYKVAAGLVTANTSVSPARTTLKLFVNGVFYSKLSEKYKVDSGISYPMAVDGSDTVPLNPGDYLDVRVNIDNGGPLALSTAAGDVYVSIELAPATALISLGSVPKLSVQGGPQSSAGSFADYTAWATPIKDNRGAFNPSTGVWTCPQDGDCYINFAALYGAVSSVFFALFVNGVQYTNPSGDNYFASQGSGDLTLSAGYLDSFKEGDLIKFQIRADGGGNIDHATLQIFMIP